MVRVEAMSLKCALFRDDPKLEACLVSDSAHVLQGARGAHVGKIQQALVMLGEAVISPSEISGSHYGPSTSAAVLAFKTKRGIINRSYQSKPDPIVGKMTIAALDREVLALQEPDQTLSNCVLFCACPLDVPGQSHGPSVRLGFAISASSAAAVGAPTPAAGPSEAAVMAAAFTESRRSLRDATGDILSVIGALRANQPLVPAQQKTFTIATKWLNLNAADKPACVTHMNAAIVLMQRNQNVKHAGADIVMTHVVGATYHGLTELSRPDLGLRCGDAFFNPDGPNCRRDVVTHEFFHLVGVKHGGGGLMGPTIRSAITTPAQALDSADNLAQMVAEMRTFKTPNTDACVRPGD